VLIAFHVALREHLELTYGTRVPDSYYAKKRCSGFVWNQNFNSGEPRHSSENLGARWIFLIFLQTVATNNKENEELDSECSSGGDNRKKEQTRTMMILVLKRKRWYLLIKIKKTKSLLLSWKRP
jgi:hypothetical protein